MASSSITSRLSQSIGRSPFALPIGLNHDILYLWATFRLRRRPIKILSLLMTLGFLCFAWEWAGHLWVRPRLIQVLSPIRSFNIQRLINAVPLPLLSFLKVVLLISIVIAALWIAFRLRSRAIRLIGWFVLILALYTGWRWAGYEWFLRMSTVDLKTVFLWTSQAIFSSLNILSCLSIFVMAQTLRRLLKEGHMETLLLVPARVRPSALFYATTTRYMPLAFIAILVLYLDPYLSPYFSRWFSISTPSLSPFERFPFSLAPTQPAPIDLGVVYWAEIRELSVFFFCPMNLFMDLALAYWLFSRWRVTYPATVAAILVIGLVTPILLMWVHELIRVYVDDQIWASSGLLSRIVRDSLARAPVPNTVQTIADSLHYFITGLASAAIGFAALMDLDARWARILRSPTKDPVLIKQPSW